MSSNYYQLGAANYICDRCGQKFKELRREWQGLMVCKNCYDPRHPVTMPLPVVIDGLPLKNARPRPNARYIDVPSSDMGIWGSYYRTGSGPSATFVIDLNWENWDAIWGGDQDMLWTPGNFPLR